MISNGLFEETNEQQFFLKHFTINYVFHFLFHITFQWKILQWKIPPYGKHKNKCENIMISRVQ